MPPKGDFLLLAQPARGDPAETRIKQESCLILSDFCGQMRLRKQGLYSHTLWFSNRQPHFEPVLFDGRFFDPELRN